MKIFYGLFWTLVLITVFAQFGTSEIIAKKEESNYENGTDIVVFKPELLDIVLTGLNLTFEFCAMNCREDFLVCFEPVSANQSGKLEFCDSTCGYYISANDKSVSFMHPFSQQHVGIPRREKCYTVSMKYHKATVYPNRKKVYSCDPKIENDMIQLNITKAGPGCPFSIKNAKLYKEEVPTPNPSSNGNAPNNENPENATPPDSSATTSKIIGNYFGWFLVLFALFYLLQ